MLHKIATAALVLSFAFIPAFTVNAQTDQPMNHQSASDNTAAPAAPAADTQTSKVIALDNKTCPVSGEHVAKDGGKKVVYKGYQINLCCPDCVESFNKNPDKYLSAILKERELNNKTCPVSGEPIPKDGGKQITYKGYQINLCCPDCVAKFNKNPDKYLKSLLKEKEAKQAVKKSDGPHADAAKPVGNANCPVSGHPVGSMAAGSHVDYKGHEVGLCCNGCIGKFNKNADKYLQAALADAKAK